MESSPAIPAASLILVRERSGNAPELLMVERAQGMAFAGGALVFPGGRIDPHDRELADNEEAAARVACVRESLEETAVPVGIDPLPGDELSLELQRALLADEPFGRLIERHGLSLNLDALTAFARWVPKFHAARRFDTYFYLARVQAPEREPTIVEGECSNACWISAGDALERDRTGQAKLIFPTRRNLERLARHDSYESMRQDAEAHAVEPITPWIEEIGGESFITIPDDSGYPVTREKLEGLWRG